VFANLHGVTEDFTLSISYRRFKRPSSKVTKISYSLLVSIVTPCILLLSLQDFIVVRTLVVSVILRLVLRSCQFVTLHIVDQAIFVNDAMERIWKEAVVGYRGTSPAVFWQIGVNPRKLFRLPGVPVLN
jgi:hypothetical protein